MPWQKSVEWPDQGIYAGWSCTPGIDATAGEYEADRQVATPVQFLRAALRLNDSFGFSGFVLALTDGYTGAIVRARRSPA